MISEEDQIKEIAEMRDQVTPTLEEMTSFNILIKEKNELYAEPSYRISPEFISKLNEHHKIQDAIEIKNKEKQYDSTLDYGELSREQYIIGIAITGFVKGSPNPKDCKECMNLIRHRRHEPNSLEVFREHMKKEHNDLYQINENLNKFLMNWILLIEEMLTMKSKEWRSKL